MVEIHVLTSALKHGISEAEILQVLADEVLTRSFPIHDDSDGNPQEMLVGFTHGALLLEIGVTYTDHHDAVFHANRVGSKYRQLFEEFDS